jgi:hypothetical protein
MIVKVEKAAEEFVKQHRSNDHGEIDEANGRWPFIPNGPAFETLGDEDRQQAAWQRTAHRYLTERLDPRICLTGLERLFSTGSTAWRMLG